MASRTPKSAKAKSATIKPAADTSRKMVVQTKVTKAVATPAVPKAAVSKAMAGDAVVPVVFGLPIKKPELIERVMTETGRKKKDVKPLVEAMLAVLGRTLSQGEEITAPPMGKLMIKRVKDMPNAKVLTLKLRIPKGVNGPT